MSENVAWVCDRCGQLLAGPDDRCNSGIHQKPGEPNDAETRGRPVRSDALLAERDALKAHAERMSADFDALTDRALDAEVERDALREAHRRCEGENDYCYVCNCHPSHSHAINCPMRDKES